MKKRLAIVLMAVTLVLFAATLGVAQGKVPKKVGWVGNYMMHEWYQTVQRGMKARAAQLGIELEVADANLDMARQVSMAEDLIAKGVDVLIISPVQQEGA